MKQIAILLLLLVHGAAGLYAQKHSAAPRPAPRATDPGSVYSVSFSPASLAFSTLDLGVERRMTDHSSLLAHSHLGFRKIHLWESLGGNYFNYGGKLEFRNYVGKNAGTPNSSLQGPYLAGWVKASTAQVNATLQQKDYTMVKSRSLAPGISAGWKFPLLRKWPKVTLDLSIGCGYKFGNVTGRYAEKSRSILFKDRGLVPALGLGVCYSPTLPAAGNRSSRERAVVKGEQSSAIAYHDRYSRKERKGIEKNLARHGLDPGRADGKFDENTIRAIRQFQRKNGLAADGKVGEATLRKMKQKKD